MTGWQKSGFRSNFFSVRVIDAIPPGRAKRHRKIVPFQQVLSQKLTGYPNVKYFEKFSKV